MKDLIHVKVECHSGYKADEYPKHFYFDDMHYDIREIIDRWYQEDRDPAFPAADYFKVCTPDEKIYILKHETRSDNWYLLIHGESMNLQP